MAGGLVGRAGIAGSEAAGPGTGSSSGTRVGTRSYAGVGAGDSVCGIPGTAATATDPCPARTLNEVDFTAT
ncbi:hypothetical protein GCM10010193_13610 [Kitasatospora atroaurantiaca]